MEVSEGTWNRIECHLRALATIQVDGNVSRCYSTSRPELQRQMRTDIFWQLLSKRNRRHSIRPVLSALFNYRNDSFKVDRVQTRQGTLVYMVVPGQSHVLHLPQLTVTCD
ncbi:hypothetical protein TNCV_4175481 [Trichonephila clavipes]|nr:hypothetical protein TNCV_4175481 [Trichonephila clavipes]